MHVRVVRFTDASSESIAAVSERIDSSDGPPPGVNATGVQVLFDKDQGTAVVLQLFATEEDMREAESVFSEMDAAETPGTRASIDRCELKVEMNAD